MNHKKKKDFFGDTLSLYWTLLMVSGPDRLLNIKMTVYSELLIRPCSEIQVFLTSAGLNFLSLQIGGFLTSLASKWKMLMSYNPTRPDMDLFLSAANSIS